MYEIRNARHNASGTIDVEWNHPQHGWIPFTASPEDSMPYGSEIHAQALAGKVAAYVAQPPNVQNRADEIEEALREIDRKSIRAMRASLRAIAKGKPMPVEQAERIDALEAQAEALRAQLANIA